MFFCAPEGVSGSPGGVLLAPRGADEARPDLISGTQGCVSAPPEGVSELFLAPQEVFLAPRGGVFLAPWEVFLAPRGGCVSGT